MPRHTRRQPAFQAGVIPEFHNLPGTDVPDDRAVRDIADQMAGVDLDAIRHQERRIRRENPFDPQPRFTPDERRAVRTAQTSAAFDRRDADQTELRLAALDNLRIGQNPFVHRDQHFQVAGGRGPRGRVGGVDTGVGDPLQAIARPDLDAQARDDAMRQEVAQDVQDRIALFGESPDGTRGLLTFPEEEAQQRRREDQGAAGRLGVVPEGNRERAAAARRALHGDRGQPGLEQQFQAHQMQAQVQRRENQRQYFQTRRPGQSFQEWMAEKGQAEAMQQQIQQQQEHERYLAAAQAIGNIGDWAQMDEDQRDALLGALDPAIQATVRRALEGAGRGEPADQPDAPAPRPMAAERAREAQSPEARQRVTQAEKTRLRNQVRDVGKRGFRGTVEAHIQAFAGSLDDIQETTQNELAEMEVLFHHLLTEAEGLAEEVGDPTIVDEIRQEIDARRDKFIEANIFRLEGLDPFHRGHQVRAEQILEERRARAEVED